MIGPGTRVDGNVQSTSQNLGTAEATWQDYRLEGGEDFGDHGERNGNGYIEVGKDTLPAQDLGCSAERYVNELLHVLAFFLRTDRYLEDAKPEELGYQLMMETTKDFVRPQLETELQLPLQPLVDP